MTERSEAVPKLLGTLAPGSLLVRGRHSALSKVVERKPWSRSQLSVREWYV